MQAQGCRLTARLVQNLLALSERPALGAAPVAGCWECQKRFKSKSKRRPFTLREDDLIQRALDDEFGSANMCVHVAHQLCRDVRVFDAVQRLALNRQPGHCLECHARSLSNLATSSMQLHVKGAVQSCLHTACWFVKRLWCHCAVMCRYKDLKREPSVVDNRGATQSVRRVLARVTLSDTRPTAGQGATTCSQSAHRRCVARGDAA